MALSFQLYSARAEPDLPDFLRVLADLGYGAVEGYPGILDDPGGLRDALDAAGLSMPTAHFPLDWVRDTPDRVKRIARTLGIGGIFVPFVTDQLRDARGWRDLGAELAAAGEAFWAEGLTFGWHNHAFEFARLETGAVPLDLILAGDARLALELDAAWAQVAGQDPAAWIDRHAGRLAAVHVKDVAPRGECRAEDGWADVGHGVMPWPALLAQLRRQAPDALLVVEHDRPADARRCAERSIRAIGAMT